MIRTAHSLVFGVVLSVINAFRNGRRDVCRAPHGEPKRWALCPGRETRADHLRRNALSAHSAALLARSSDGPGDSADANELPAAIDVAPGHAREGFAELLRFRPNSQLMDAAEFHPR